MNRTQRVLEKMKGPVVPINVCFNEEGAVNHSAVAAYVDWLCTEGTRVLLLTAGSSEFVSLSESEIWELTATVGRANAGRALFVAATGFWKPALTRDFLKHADAVGADAVKVQISHGLPSTREVVVRYFDFIDGASDIPLLLWTTKASSFAVELVAELAGCPNIVGMKNDGDAFADYYDYIRATGDKDFAVISGGQMRNFVFGHQIGSPAYLCTIAPFRPDLALQFYNLVVGGNYQQCWEWVFRYEDPWLNWAIRRNWHVVMKSTVQLQGLYPNNLLGPPLPPPDPGVLGEVRAKLEEVFGSSRTR